MARENEIVWGLVRAVLLSWAETCILFIGTLESLDQ